MSKKQSASFDYLAELDGLRAISILLVLLAHFGLGNFIPGGFGVTVFFFISGFLITRLLVAETKLTGTLSLRAFYVRRFRRLGPALIVVIVFTTAGFIATNRFVSSGQLSAAFFYYMNYYVLSDAPQPLPLGALWSLAVEEQYYIVFPLFLAFMSRFSAFALTISLCMISAGILVWRIIYVLVL